MPQTCVSIEINLMEKFSMSYTWFDEKYFSLARRTNKLISYRNSKYKLFCWRFQNDMSVGFEKLSVY